MIIPFYKNFLYKDFLEWFVGFVNAEGNFNIKLTDISVNTFKYVQLIFQITFDEEKFLNYFINNINCGHINKSNNKLFC